MEGKIPLWEKEEFKRGLSNGIEILTYREIFSEDVLGLILVDVSTFWSIYDELQKEIDDYGSGFWAHRDDLLIAFQERRMFTLSALIIDEWDPNNQFNHIFLKNTYYRLPCFLVIKSDGITLEYIWVANRAKKMNLASYLIKKSKVKKVENIVTSTESLSFWYKKREKDGLEFDIDSDELLDAFGILNNDDLKNNMLLEIDTYDMNQLLVNYNKKRNEHLADQ